MDTPSAVQTSAPKTRKPGSGRTKGATSLVSVPLSALTAKFGPDDLVVVGRVFVQKAGIDYSAPAISAPLTDEEKAGVQIVTV